MPDDNRPVVELPQSQLGQPFLECSASLAGFGRFISTGLETPAGVDRAQPIPSQSTGDWRTPS